MTTSNFDNAEFAWKANGWYFLKGATSTIPDGIGQYNSVIVYVVDGLIVAAQDERTRPVWDTWVAEGVSGAWRSVPYGMVTPLHIPETWAHIQRQAAAFRKRPKLPNDDGANDEELFP